MRARYAVGYVSGAYLRYARDSTVPFKLTVIEREGGEPSYFPFPML